MLCSQRPPPPTCLSVPSLASIDIETEAILSIDDDIRIPCEDLEKAFQVTNPPPPFPPAPLRASRNRS